MASYPHLPHTFQTRPAGGASLSSCPCCHWALARQHSTCPQTHRGSRWFLEAHPDHSSTWRLHRGVPRPVLGHLAQCPEQVSVAVLEDESPWGVGGLASRLRFPWSPRWLHRNLLWSVGLPLQVSQGQGDSHPNPLLRHLRRNAHGAGLQTAPGSGVLVISLEVRTTGRPTPASLVPTGSCSPLLPGASPSPLAAQLGPGAPGGGGEVGGL